MSFTHNQHQGLINTTCFPNSTSTLLHDMHWAHAGHTAFPANSESHREQCTHLPRHLFTDRTIIRGPAEWLSSRWESPSNGYWESHLVKPKGPNTTPGTLRSLSFTQRSTWPRHSKLGSTVFPTTLLYQGTLQMMHAHNTRFLIPSYSFWEELFQLRHLGPFSQHAL